MKKEKTKARTCSRARTVGKWISLTLLILMMILLCAEALMPGTRSSQQSSGLGGVIDDVLTGLGGDDIQDVPPTSVRILHGGEVKESISFAYGEHLTLAADIAPSDTSVNYRKVIWTSGDAKIATVSGGTVTARGIGSTTITATLESDPELSSSVEVTVYEVFATDFTLLFGDGKDAATLEVGTSAKLSAKLTPAKASANITYKSSNTSVATVNSSGLVKAVAEGDATITATYTSLTEKDGEFVTLQAAAKVTVVLNTEVIIPPESLEIVLPDGISDHLYAGMGATLSAKTYPVESTQGFVWSSSDSNVISINSKTGAISAKKKGVATITVASSVASSVKAQIQFNVYNEKVGAQVSAPESANWKGTEDPFAYTLKATAGTSVQLTVTAELDKDEYFVRYETENAEIVEISEDGTILLCRATSKKIKVTVKVADNAEFSDEDGDLVETFEIFVTVAKQPFSKTMKNWATWVRKVFGHFGAFCLLGILAGVTFLLFDKKSWAGRFILLAVGLVYGLAFAGLTEILQLPVFTVGRGASFRDVLIDYSGFAPAFMAVYGLYLFICMIVESIKKARKKSHRTKGK